MSIFRFTKIFRRHTCNDFEKLELVFWREGTNVCLVFRSSDFFLVNAPQNMRMGLYGEIPLDQISNKAYELEVEGLFESRNWENTYIVLKNEVIVKIADQFNMLYGPVRLVADYADKIMHNKTYMEWSREINSCLPKDIIDFRFNGLPATGL